jgi:hypothetical protein
MMSTEQELREIMESEVGREEREANEERMKREDRLIMAMRNAEALAQAMCKQGERFDELTERMNRVAGTVGNLQNELANHKNLIVMSLQQKYGTGSTEPGE